MSYYDFWIIYNYGDAGQRNFLLIKVLGNVAILLALIILCVNIIIIRRRTKKYNKIIIEQLKENNEHLRNIEEYHRLTKCEHFIEKQ